MFRSPLKYYDASNTVAKVQSQASETHQIISREVFENQDNHYHQMQSMQSMKIGAHVIDSWFDTGNWLLYFGLVDPRGGKNVELGNLVPGK